MDTLLTERNLAKETDNAQRAIDEKLQQTAISARETEFIFPSRPMSGDINLSKLSSLNITAIISKSSTSVTSITGIPEGVKKLKLANQLLIESPQLPKSVEILDLDKNYIESINLSNAKKLKVLTLNSNRLKKIDYLPESLEELYLDNNHIKKLNLEGLSKLRVLHCRNNSTIRIENIPASIVDLQVEDGNPNILLDYDYLPNNATSEESSRFKGTELEFVDSMRDYFELKTTYEKDATNSRAAAKSKALRRGMSNKMAGKISSRIRPKCVNCKRPVGTVFKTRNHRFLAHCGDTKSPCALRIEIYRGEFEHDDKMIEDIKTELFDVKEQIIRQKMDVLFNYASEEETVAKFKDLIEDYNLYAYLYKTDTDKREEKRFNIHKRELIKAKLKLLNELKTTMNIHMEEYETSGNRDSIHYAMDIYVREFMPEMNNLRMLKYSVMEMLTPLSESDKPTMNRKLNQSAVSMRQIETLQGEVPRVLKFTVGNGNPPDSEEPEKDIQEELEDEDDEDEKVSFEPEREEE